ncbi:MAG: hypothetical protein Q7S12_01880 [bacterium]|nr:hypothetical protein [bacterium]
MNQNIRNILISIFGILVFAVLFSGGKGDAPSAMALGNRYFNGPEYDLVKAEEAFQRAVRIDPKILFGHYQLARIYFLKSDSKNALKEINLELEKNPQNLRSLYIRGLIYGYSNKLPEAEADFRNFIAWVPREWAGYNDLLWILMQQEKYEEAKKMVAVAFAEATDAETNPWLWNMRGAAELNLKEYAVAKISFTRAKALAESLTLQDWQNAYPGNNSGEAAGGLAAFRRAIDENLHRAERGI